MLDATLPAVLALGFLLGLRHALDADHVAAVAVFAAGRGGLRRALEAGLSWGAGHALVLGTVGGILVALRVVVPERLVLLFEMIVALTLVVLGASALGGALRARVHSHRHEHDGEVHEHLHFHAVPHAVESRAAAGEGHRHPHPVRLAVRPFLVGGLHGLAGSGALVLLVLATIPAVLPGLLYLGLFGAGSIAGMGLMSLAIGAPLSIARGRAGVQRALCAAAGVGSLGLGLALAWEVGVGRGLLFP
jgi:hypothetical protein